MLESRKKQYWNLGKTKLLEQSMKWHALDITKCRNFCWGPAMPPIYGQNCGLKAWSPSSQWERKRNSERPDSTLIKLTINRRKMLEPTSSHCWGEPDCFSAQAVRRLDHFPWCPESRAELKSRFRSMTWSWCTSYLPCAQSWLRRPNMRCPLPIWMLSDLW